MRHAKTVTAPQGGERAISRRRFIGVTAGATAALSFGTFIRSGLGAAKVNVLTWSNTLSAMDDVLREQAKQYTKEKGGRGQLRVHQPDRPPHQDRGRGGEWGRPRYHHPLERWAAPA